MADAPKTSERQPLLTGPIGGEINPSDAAPGDTVFIPTSDHNDTNASHNPSGGIVLKVIAVMYCFFYVGMSVTAVGALLDDIKVYYQIDNSTATLIFPTSIFGYIFATLSLPFVAMRTGWRGVAFISGTCYVIAASIIGTGFLFPLILTGHLIGGVAYGLSDAGFNVWASKRRKANVVQGYLHSAFAIGSIVGPVATLVVTNNHLQWYNFYQITIILSVLVLLSLGLAFRREWPERDAVTKDNAEEQASSRIKLVKLVAYCCLFYFVYMAIESSFTNWIVSYMKSVRGLNQTKAALSSSIFWIGMVVGRLILGPVSEYFGTGVAVCGYILVSICAQVAFTLVDNTVASFVLLAITGCFIGPLFPSAIINLSRKLSNREALVAVSVAIAVGQVGGALVPVTIGFMADKFGLRHLPDVILGLLVLLWFIWVAFVRSN